MNKKEFIKKLSKIIKYDENKCIFINNIKEKLKHPFYSID